MPYNDQTTAPESKTAGTETRDVGGFPVTVTKVFESLGVLNKGSSKSPPTPEVDEAAKTTGISNNTLNVTRVGGLASLIAAAGAAALALFNVHKATDKASIVVAAYISVGAIVVAALLTAAIIISADIRSRTSLNQPPAPASGTNSKAKSETAANSFHDAWYQALSILHNAVDQLEHTQNDSPGEWIKGSTKAWFDASGSSGKIANLHPADGDQATLHASLKAGQSNVLSQLDKLVNTADYAKKADTVSMIRPVLDSMDHSLPWP